MVKTFKDIVITPCRGINDPVLFELLLLGISISNSINKVTIEDDISDRNMKLLIRTLKDNKMIRQLDIDDYNFLDNSLHDIYKLLDSNMTLRSITLPDIYYNEQIYIDELLLRNKQIRDKILVLHLIDRCKDKSVCRLVLRRVISILNN
jgi:hypothetical protein